VSEIHDPTPFEPPPPLDVDDLLAMADEAIAEQARNDVAFMQRVESLPGPLGELIRSVAFARTALHNAEQWGGVTGGEFDRWLPVIEACEELVNELQGGAS
jgi:hypothetical protein